MALTTPALVQGVLGDDYGPNEAGNNPDLQPYIDAADVVVTRLVTAAARKRFVHTAVELEIIERWLAAHMYALSDKPYQSRSTQGASGQFAGQTGMGFEATQYGLNACRLDASGCLFNLDKQQRAGGFALGHRHHRRDND